MMLSRNILLALVWTMMTADMSFSNWIVGFVLGYACLHIQQSLTGPSTYFQKIRQIVSFGFYFAWELVRSSVMVAHDVLTPTFYARPGIIAVPLDAKTDIEITSLANAITLTPGSLTLDVSEDRSMLFVHALFIDDPDAVKNRIKNGLERRLLEVLR